MIRPITIVTFLMACGSGLYLYQSKHEVQLLDRTIEKTVHETAALREQSRLLSAEWTMLNDPDRLRKFSDTYLNLKSISPTQFTSLNDLDGKLPAPRIEAPEPRPADTPIAADTAPVGADDPAPATVADETEFPVPPIPVIRSVQAPPPRPAEAKVATARPTTVVDAKPVEPRPAEPKAAPRVAEARPEVRVPPVPKPMVLAAPRPQPVNPQPAAVPAPLPFRPAPQVAATPPVAAPYSGSLLGMARGAMPPAPRPVPVNATYNAN